VCYPLGILAEFIFEKRKNKKVSEAVLITITLYVLSMPPQVPLWIAGVGIVFAVVLAKEVFGGFGRNPFNPAIAGRLFVYITFPIPMTEGWLVPGNFGLDAVTSATPLSVMRAGELINPLDLFLGIRPGSLGESAIIPIILAALYLVFTKTASYRIILATLGSAALMSFTFDFFKVPGALPLLPALMSGSLLFVTVFMATDPVSGPKNPLAQVIYGVMIGSILVLVRTFSLFSEGTSFAVIISNTFASLLDEITGKKKK
ncbi:MAG: RnfABCDGE type electron transport complex subunit D, partial [Spirochaetales bacterium]|nr:RnfABCDGE type electron transport complex subunit D [Spirochaetales bacterium]